MEPRSQGVLKRAGRLVEQFQVELYCRYSTQRIKDFGAYYRGTTSTRSVMVMFVTAIPCPVLSTRLAKPSAGVGANSSFFAREAVVFWAFSYLAAYHEGHFVSSISLTARELILASTISSLGTTGTTKVWVCQCCLVAIYPGYFSKFTSIPPLGQLPFACLLPIIKVLVRNRALERLRDETPEHVLLNADVFSALFVAYCMQTVPSIWATAGLMAIDGVQILVAMRDVRRFLAEIDAFRTLLFNENEPSRLGSTIARKICWIWQTQLSRRARLQNQWWFAKKDSLVD